MYDPQQYQYGQEGGLRNYILQMAMGGGGDSAAQLQQKQGLESALRQQRAMMAGQIGINPALAARRTQQAGNQLQTQVMGQAAQQRAQEQMAFLQQMLGLEQMQGGAQAQANDIKNQQSMLQEQLRNDMINSIIGGVFGAAGSLGGSAMKAFGPNPMG